MSEKINVITFTDPMMGLSYESEPVFRKLETHFDDNIEFQYLMNVLVRDVFELVDSSDLFISKELAVKNYNAKLAKIYESEESISDMPINMKDFRLFSTENTTSLPLNLAYKAVQIIDSRKADEFLYKLRYATIVDCRPTTRTDEILKVVREIKIDEKEFLNQFTGKKAAESLEKDLKFAYRLGIRTLPAYLIMYGEEGALYQRLLNYDDFVRIIDHLSNNKIKPRTVEKNLDSLRKFLRNHSLISSIEIREAFDFNNLDEVMKFIMPMVETNEIKIVDVGRGWFVKVNI